ncbi:MAG: hypothetical protein HPZ82_06540 [Coprobacter sp.]|nr:hypothetical protein [Coprobacter sp.]
MNKQIADDYNANQLLLAENQQDYDREMWEKNNEWNLEMWNKQNEYNSPAAQMERYQKAGLNPNLIYGQQNTAGSIQGSSPLQARSPNQTKATMQAPVSKFDLLPILNYYQDFKVKDAQVNNIKANTSLAIQKGLTEMEETELRKKKKERAGLDNDHYATIYPILEDIERAKKINLQYQNDIMWKQADDARRGIDPNTPWWARGLMRWLGIKTEEIPSILGYQE